MKLRSGLWAALAGGTLAGALDILFATSFAASGGVARLACCKASQAAGWGMRPLPAACPRCRMLSGQNPRLRKKSARPSEMSGYPYSAPGYPANFQIGLASAADSGLPNAHDAWMLFESRSVKPASPHAYNDYPNFVVMPRSVSY